MRNVTEHNITDAVLATMAAATDPRAKQVMSSLVRHLHDFVREVELTQAEWMAAIEFLVKVGQKTTPERNEFILASDTLGISSLVDMVNNRSVPGATDTSVLGPFYIDGTRMPTLDLGGDLIGDNEGEPGLVMGRVTTPDGRPIAGALLEIWQNASNGQYESEDPNQAEGNLRGKLHTDAEGRYRFTTTKPVAYTVPYDGPVGDMLRAFGRHAWRPAHIHFIVSAPTYRPIVTELFVADDTYLDEDAVFGVRESLVVDFRRLESADEAAAYHVEPGYWLVEYDFRLQPAA